MHKEHALLIHTCIPHARKYSTKKVILTAKGEKQTSTFTNHNKKTRTSKP